MGPRMRRGERVACLEGVFNKQEGGFPAKWLDLEQDSYQRRCTGGKLTDVFAAIFGRGFGYRDLKRVFGRARVLELRL